MKDSFAYKIYNSSGLIISECSTMVEAIARAKLHNCNWVRAPKQEVGHMIEL